LRLAPCVGDVAIAAGPEGRWMEAGFTVRRGHDFVRSGRALGTTSTVLGAGRVRVVRPCSVDEIQKQERL
jgi:hypothetical protein